MNYGFWNAYKDLKQAEKDAEKAAVEAQVAYVEAARSQEGASKELADKKQEEIAAMERLIAEKQANAYEYTLSAHARYYEAQKRGELGMDAQTLAIIGNTQQQLQQEEIDLLKSELDTERQEGVADLKFPIGLAIGFVVIAGGILYWRK